MLVNVVDAAVGVLMSVRVRDRAGAESEAVQTAVGSTAVLRLLGPSATDNAEDQALQVVDVLDSQLAALEDSTALRSVEESLVGLRSASDLAGLAGRLGSRQSGFGCNSTNCVSAIPGEVAECYAGQCVTGTNTVLPDHAVAASCPGSSGGLYDLKGLNGLVIPALECSGHGTCVRFPTQDCGARADDLRQCTALCICTASWGGDRCDISSTMLPPVKSLKGRAANGMDLALDG